MNEVENRGDEVEKEEETRQRKTKVKNGKTL